ncbi:MAG: hypothetical protein AAFX01_00715 [Cyanobacteria bacterium J06638_28]
MLRGIVIPLPVISDSLAVDHPPNSPPESLPRFTRSDWLLLLFSLFWAGNTGMFLALPSLSWWVGISGLAIALLYAAAVTLFQRRAIYGAIALTILLAVVFPNWEAAIVGYAVATTLTLNFLLFGELGVIFRRLTSPRQVFIRLGGLFVSALSIGWLIGVGFT